MFRTRAVLVALTATALLLPVLPAQAAAERQVEVWATPGDTIVTLTGRGYGHGNGLSQYGAQGAALQGQTWQQILAFYYPGTTIEPIKGKIRVLLTADTTADLQVRAQQGLKVRRIGHGRTWKLPTRSVRKWRVIAKGSDSVVQRTNGRGWRTHKRIRGEAEFLSSTRKLTLVTPSGQHTYRGVLQSVAAAPGKKRETVNRLSLEAYLRGVVPREVPAEWEPQAVSAQSVAARTYAAFERASSTTPHYDLCDTTSCQVYGGVDDEHPDADAAIRATAKLGVFHAGAPAFTQFSASNGGYSSAGSMPYLVAQPDPYDGYAEWSFTTYDSELEQHWPAIGDLTSIEVTSRDGNGAWGGRVLTMSLVGTTGRADVSGDDLRSVLGLKSEWFTLSVAPQVQGRRLDP